MNPENYATFDAANYATFDAAKRLATAGIVMKTALYWVYDAYNSYATLRYYGEWNKHYTSNQKLPAPMFVEVWGELPPTITTSYTYELTLEKMDSGLTRASYENYTFGTASSFLERNPTDACIDLLIWVRQGKKDIKCEVCQGMGHDAGDHVL